MNWAPARMQARAVSGSSTVPAPNTIWSPNLSATFSSARIAPGTVIVISATRIPPRYTASMARMAPSALSVRTTGTMPISRIVDKIASLFIFLSDISVRAEPIHFIANRVFEWPEGGAQFADRLGGVHLVLAVDGANTSERNQSLTTG